MSRPKLLRKTKRLVIRPLQSSDYRAWLHANTTMLEPLNRWDRKNKNPEESSRSTFNKILSRQKKLRTKDEFYDLAVFEKSSGEHVGYVAIMNVLRAIGQSAFLGYFMNNRHWGKGYGKEAVRATLDIAFRDLKLHRIEAGIEPGNRRSILLARSLGLRKEGLKKRAVFLRNQWVDLVIYSVTCEELGIKWTTIPQPRLH